MCRRTQNYVNGFPEKARGTFLRYSAASTRAARKPLNKKTRAASSVRSRSQKRSVASRGSPAHIPTTSSGSAYSGRRRRCGGASGSGSRQGSPPAWLGKRVGCGSAASPGSASTNSDSNTVSSQTTSGEGSRGGSAPQGSNGRITTTPAARWAGGNNGTSSHGYETNVKQRQQSDNGSGSIGYRTRNETSSPSQPENPNIAPSDHRERAGAGEGDISPLGETTPTSSPGFFILRRSFARRSTASGDVPASILARRRATSASTARRSSPSARSSAPRARSPRRIRVALVTRSPARISNPKNTAGEEKKARKPVGRSEVPAMGVRKP